MVASVGFTENQDCSNPIATFIGLPELSYGEFQTISQNGSTVRFSCKSTIESNSDNHDFLNQQVLDYLAKYVRKQTRQSYSSGWHQFPKFSMEKINSTNGFVTIYSEIYLSYV